MHVDRPTVLWTDRGRALYRVSGSFVDLMGDPATDLGESDLLSHIHPQDRPALAEILNAGWGAVTARHRSVSGSWVEFDWEVRPSAGDQVVLGLLTNHPKRPTPIPESPRSEASPLTRTLTAMAQTVEANNPGLRCSIRLSDEERRHVSVGAGPSLPAEYNAAVEGLEIGPAVGSCGTATFWNVPVIVEDIESDVLWKDLRSAAALAGVSACWSHPITSLAGEVLGAIALYSDEPSRPEQHHLDGLEIAARMVGLAVEHEGLEQQVRASAKAEAIGILAGGVAHDFNNLLAVILGRAELLLGGESIEQPQRDLLTDIVTASLSATDLCGQLLAYAGRRSPASERVDVNELVRELGGLLQAAMPRNVTLVFDLDEEPLVVIGDRSQVGQVIMNLITNASEAIGDAEGTLEVSSRSRRLDSESLTGRFGELALEPGTYVELAVSDTGHGVNPELAQRVFDPFFTTKPRGRGLGLAAVQGIVRAHRGAIRVDSTAGGGATFTVVLPQTDVCVEANDPPAQLQPASRQRVLVADDDPAVRQVMREILESGGYDTVGASNGADAVAIFAEEHASIDLVILDLSMPVLGGREAVPALRAIAEDVPLILMSGYSDADMFEAIDSGEVDGSLHKPAKLQVVLEVAAEAIQGNVSARA